MRNLYSFAGPLLAGAILAATASAAEPVYKWTDSSGHSHYSQTPPQGQKYQTITPAGPVSDTTPTAPTTDPAAGATTATPPAKGPTPAQVARQKLCDTARSNVQTLANKPIVNMDLDGSGKPKRLTPAEQAQQLDKATQQVQALCAK